MPLTSYKELVVWQSAVATACAAYRLTSSYPQSERFGLVSQIRRAAVSVPANIAEGYGRSTRGEYLNHVSNAAGSANELETLCILSRLLRIAPESAVVVVEAQVVEVQRLLGRLRQGLRRR